MKTIAYITASLIALAALPAATAWTTVTHYEAAPLGPCDSWDDTIGCTLGKVVCAVGGSDCHIHVQVEDTYCVVFYPYEGGKVTYACYIGGVPP